MVSASEKEQLSERITELTGWIVKPYRFEVITDTSEWMNIQRGYVVRIGGNDYLIKGNMSETRFGIEEQPKYWVFQAVDLSDGSVKILKTEFHEEFIAHISILKIRCYRSPEKESKVLELVRGDHRFMQGCTCFDEKNNNVRIIDFIRGKTFFTYVPSINKPHEQYFFEDLPGILRKVNDTILAIKLLHENNLCHGDIRNDHIIIDNETGDYRWIDFDLKQDVSDFDIWSFGNILGYAVAKGIRTFKSILKGDEFPESVKRSLAYEDSSAFYEYRVMNLRKLYPYIPDKLSNILLHFTIKPKAYYSGISELCSDYQEMLDKEFPLK